MLHRLLMSFVLAAGVWLPPTAALAAEPSETTDETAEIPVRSALETAVLPLLQPVRQRLVLRNDANQYDVWLVTKLDFEKASEVFRLAISAKQALDGGARVERWTWIDTDHSYVLDIAAGGGSHRVRLTKHLAGALLELDGVGAAQDAPRWAPPYRPRPLLLPHGVNSGAPAN